MKPDADKSGGAAVPQIRTGWREVLAFAAFTAITVQLLGGIALSFHYVPTTDAAHASLLALEQDHKYGVSMRALHWLGGSAVVGLVLLHLFTAFVAGDYKKPGRGAWVTGVLVLFVIVGFGITGELLPWTEQAVQAAEVRTGLLARAPEGELIRTAVLGGTEIAEPTLTRFHVLHTIVLPMVLVGLIVVHVRARRRIGRPQFVTFGQACAGLLVAAGLAYGARELRAPLGSVHVAGESGFEAWPEWYFLWLNKLLKVFPPELEAIPAFWIPNGLALLLLALPFLDFRKARDWRDRPLAILAATAVVLALVGLSVANLRDRPDNDPRPPYDLSWNASERLGYALVRREGCLECHRITAGDQTFGVEKHDAPNLDDLDPGMPLDELIAIVKDAEQELGTLDMPAFDHLPDEGLRAIGLYLKRLNPED